MCESGGRGKIIVAYLLFMYAVCHMTSDDIILQYGVNKRCHETPHRPHRRQIQVRDIGKMCLVRCILLISNFRLRNVTGYGFHAFLTWHFVTFAAYSV